MLLSYKHRTSALLILAITLGCTSGRPEILEAGKHDGVREEEEGNPGREGEELATVHVRETSTAWE